MLGMGWVRVCHSSGTAPVVPRNALDSRHLGREGRLDTRKMLAFYLYCVEVAETDQQCDERRGKLLWVDVEKRMLFAFRPGEQMIYPFGLETGKHSQVLGGRFRWLRICLVSALSGFG